MRERRECATSIRVRSSALVYLCSSRTSGLLDSHYSGHRACIPARRGASGEVLIVGAGVRAGCAATAVVCTAHLGVLVSSPSAPELAALVTFVTSAAARRGDDLGRQLPAIARYTGGGRKKHFDFGAQ